MLLAFPRLFRVQVGQCRTQLQFRVPSLHRRLCILRPSLASQPSSFAPLSNNPPQCLWPHTHPPHPVAQVTLPCVRHHCRTRCRRSVTSETQKMLDVEDEGSGSSRCARLLWPPVTSPLPLVQCVCDCVLGVTTHLVFVDPHGGPWARLLWFGSALSELCCLH
jgi:hypothetical protein